MAAASWGGSGDGGQQPQDVDDRVDGERGAGRHLRDGGAGGLPACLLPAGRGAGRDEPRLQPGQCEPRGHRGSPTKEEREESLPTQRVQSLN